MHFCSLLVRQKAKTRGREFFVRPVELWTAVNFTDFCFAFGVASSPSDIMNYYLQNLRILVNDANVAFAEKADKLERSYKQVRHKSCPVWLLKRLVIGLLNQA